MTGPSGLHPSFAIAFRSSSTGARSGSIAHTCTHRCSASIGESIIARVASSLPSFQWAGMTPWTRRTSAEKPPSEPPSDLTTVLCSAEIDWPGGGKRKRMVKRAGSRVRPRTIPRATPLL